MFINKLILWTDSVFDHRYKLYKELVSYDYFWRDYLCKEPHAFLHVGWLLQKFKLNLNNKNLLSFGLDILKDSIIVNHTNSSMDVYDLDKKTINLLNKQLIYWGIDSKIKYKYGDVLNIEISKSYDALILSQMDYIFSDLQLQKIFYNAKQSRIKNIYLLTPSVFELSLNPIKFLELCYNILLSLNSLRKKKVNSHKTYRRRYSFLKKLISKYYEIEEDFEYKYPYGRIRLLKLTLR